MRKSGHCKERPTKRSTHNRLKMSKSNASADSNSDASLSAKRQRLQKLQKEVRDKQETVDKLVRRPLTF